MEPSTSNPPKKPGKSKRKKKRNSKKLRSSNKRKPNWLELPGDVWFHILSRLTTFDLIENAQKVCMLFRSICKQPSMFKSIDMSHDDCNIYNAYPEDLMMITCHAVDRSAGGLIDIFLEYVDDPTLMYIADRSNNLKHLRLGHGCEVFGEELIKVIQKLPKLEELLLICPVTSGTVENIGSTCTLLKSFSLTKIRYLSRVKFCNEDGLAIAKSMPHLRHLQLIGNRVDNEGLKAILVGCPLLESLDLHDCPNIDLSGELGKRCARIIKQLPHVCDSTSTIDYGRQFYDEMVSHLGYNSWDEYTDDNNFDADYYYDYDDLMDGYLDYDDFTDPTAYGDFW